MNGTVDTLGGGSGTDTLLFEAGANSLGGIRVTMQDGEAVADLTYVPTGEGWLFLAAIIDMATRKVVGWAMRQTLHADIATLPQRV